MSAPPVYLDHAATTPVRPEVLEAMLPWLGERFGNPSSTHRWGREARVALDAARERIASTLGAHADEVCFSSGGTEADNLAVLGAWRARPAGRDAVVTSPVEHKAVLEAVHAVAREGGTERLVPVDANGVVDVAAFAATCGDDAAVASVMWVNNETGVVQPVAALGAAARERGVRFHTDAVQAVGKERIDLAELPVDLLALSGHKIGAPKGIGALFVRRGCDLAPLMHGGAQDRGRRPGTENVAFAVGLATACELAESEREATVAHDRRLRDRLEAALRAGLPDVVVHGADVERAPHVCNASFPGAETETLLMALDLRGVAASAGSACQSGSVGASHVLAAMGVAPDLAASALRMSVGAANDDAQIDRAAEQLVALVRRARGLAPA